MYLHTLLCMYVNSNQHLFNYNINIIVYFVGRTTGGPVDLNIVMVPIAVVAAAMSSRKSMYNLDNMKIGISFCTFWIQNIPQ